MKKLVVHLSVALLGLLAIQSVKAAPVTVAKWTFETTSNSITGSGATLGGIAADIGSGTASGTHVGPGASSTVWSHPAGNGSPSSFSSDHWNINSYYQFQVNLTGYKDVTITFDQTRSAIAPTTLDSFTFQFSTNGTTFTTLGSPYIVLTNGTSPFLTWNTTTSDSGYTFSVDLSAEDELDDAPLVYFRLVDGSTTSPGGSVASSRVDNFDVEAALIPEPTSFALVVMGGFAMWGRSIGRRRKR